MPNTSKSPRAKPPMRSVAERNALVEANKGLIYHIVDSWATSNDDRDECISVCSVAMMRAATSFDPSRGYKFSTYACKVMHRAIYRMRGEQYAKPAQVGLAKWQTPSIEAVIHMGATVPELESALMQLSKNDRELLCRRFGIGRPKETFKSMAVGQKVSKERIRQLQIVAIERLREIMDLTR
jgi:RNA polymerase primary sigma factor